MCASTVSLVKIGSLGRMVSPLRSASNILISRDYTSEVLTSSNFMSRCAPMAEDHIDHLLARLDAAGARLDLDVEGIVDRISSINKRVRTALKDTLADYGITPEDWGVLTS